MASPAQLILSAPRFGPVPPPKVQPGPELPRNRKPQVYGTKPTKQSSSAAHFVPVGPYDVTLASLRMVIFQIEETSATLIAQVIREELNDTQICNLLSNVNTVPNKHAGATSIPSQSRNGRDTLRKKMDEARIELAKRLRDGGFVDVDVIYTVEEYRIEPFKSNKEQISSLGGNVYHMYPFRKVEKEMAFSVVVQPWVLEKICPPEHREKWNISFKTNTAPAPALTIIPDPKPKVQVPRPNTIFPYHDSSADNDLTSLEKVDKILEESEARKKTKTLITKRSNSLEKVREIPKGTPWHPFDEPSRAGNHKQPTWNAENAPFHDTPGVHGDDQWWLDDLAVRRGAIDKWKKRTVKLNDLGYGRVVLSEADPETAVAGVDFKVVPPMCKTYTAGLGIEKYDDYTRIATATIMKELQAADKAYDDYVPKLEVFYEKYAAVQLDFSLKASDPEEWERVMETARRMEEILRTQLRLRGELLQEKAMECEAPVNPAKFEIAAVLEKKMLQAVITGMEKRRDAVPSEESPPSPCPTVRPGTPMPGSLPIPIAFRSRELTKARVVPAVANIAQGTPAKPVLSVSCSPETEWETLLRRKAPAGILVKRGAQQETGRVDSTRVGSRVVWSSLPREAEEGVGECGGAAAGG